MAELPHEGEMDSLLRFTESFKFESFVQAHLIPPEGSDFNDGADVVRSSARMVGQAKDGAILFSWRKKTNAGEIVTNVGWHGQGAAGYRILYQFDSAVEVCAASVNYELTLLAYTVKQEVENEMIYESFVAEIQPQGRTFTLNIPGCEFRMLQFLQPETVKNRRNLQMSQLLVVIPDVIISLYYFKMQLVRTGVTLISEPEQETIQKHFSWYQWDPHTQWLYHGSFEASSSPTAVNRQHSLIVHCENFSQGTRQLLFTVTLPLPYSCDLYCSSTTYYESPFAFTCPVRETNMQVLYRRDGYWCICLQHCTGIASTSSDSPQDGRIDYSVFILHNGYVMEGQVPLAEPTNEAMYIHFMLIGCFIAAYIPGVMLHLLNVGPRVDPCHHIAFGPELTPSLSTTGMVFNEAPPTLRNVKAGSIVEASGEMPTLTSAVSTSLLGDYNTSVMDCTSGVIFECGLNISAFFQLFKASSQQPELMEDLLHLMIVGFRHHGMALSMIELICQTPMQLSDHRLFSEFLIASSFANVYFDCKRSLAKRLPLTISPTFRGKVFKNPDGSKLAMIKISPIVRFDKQLLIQSDHRLIAPSQDDLLNYSQTNEPFQNLCFNVVVSEKCGQRIDIRTMMAEAAAKEKQEAENQSLSASSSLRQRSKVVKKSSTPSPRTPPTSSGTPTSLFSRLSTLTRRSLSTRAQPVQVYQVAQDMLTFLEADEDLMDMLSDQASSIRERFLKAVSDGLPLRSKNMAYNTIATYYTELEKQSSTLLLVVWQSLGFSMENHPINVSICRTPTTKEQILFELLEAYQLAHTDIGIPLPMGFHTLFISMGFLCLEKGLFLQYLRNGVFTPTKRFVELLIEDSEVEDDTIIFQVIANLEPRLCEYALERWHNPTVSSLDNSRPSIERTVS